MTNLLARNWWVFVLRGVCGVIFGILALVFPGVTLTVLIIFFGAYAFVDGILSIVAGFRAAAHHERWWPLILEGVCGVIVGIIAFISPVAAAIGILYLVCGWAIVTGILEISAAIRLRKEIQGEWLLILSGVLSVLLGFLLAFQPLIGLVALAWWVGAYALIFGGVLIALGFRLKRHGSETAAKPA